YLPPADAPAVTPPPAATPGAPVTFGCFNNLGKISDELLSAWSRILRAVPASRLLLKGRGLGDAAVRAGYLERFTAQGIAPNLVELLERTTTADDHLAVYGRVDVALDTFPYNCTTTTCEALWMGVPVVSRRGDCHAARVGASLLIAAGHPEWIAETEE